MPYIDPLGFSGDSSISNFILEVGFILERICFRRNNVSFCLGGLPLEG